jgi:hypothetical protein
MKTRLAFFGLIFLQAAACSGAPSDSASQPLFTTICALSAQGKKMDGILVRFKATYITDLRHGAFLTDSKCPSVFVEQGLDPVNVDASVPRFDEVVKGNIFDHKPRKFVVDVSGTFAWNSGGMLHGVPAAGTTIPHGVIAIEKIWSYQRVAPKN